MTTGNILSFSQKNAEIFNKLKNNHILLQVFSVEFICSSKFTWLPEYQFVREKWNLKSKSDP